MSKRLVCLLAFLLALLLCAPMFAQEFQAGIRGIVKDSQGAVVPGVPIEAQNLATNEISHATTNEAGLYAFPVLPIGTYRVTATATGFKKAVRDNLELRLGDQVQQDFTLEVGAVTEQVTVSAGAELLQALPSEKGQVVGEENVADLPSQARNPFLLGIVATGVQFDIGANALSRSARPFDAGNNVAESMSINGGITGASDLLLDGVPNTGTEGSSAANMGFVPPPEAVAGIQDSEQQLRRAVRAHLGRHHDGQREERDQPASWVSLLVKQEHGPHRQRLRPEPDRRHARRVSREQPGPRDRRAGGDSACLQRPQQDLLHVVVRDLALRHSDAQHANAAVPGGGAGELQHHAAKQRHAHHHLRPEHHHADGDDVLAAAISRRHYSVDPHERGGGQDCQLHSRAQRRGRHQQLHNLAQCANRRLRLPRDPHRPADQRQEPLLFALRARLPHRNQRRLRLAAGGRAGNSYSDGRLNQGGNADLTTVLSPSTVLTSRLGYFRHDLWITLYASGFNPTTLGFPSSLLNTQPPYFPTIGVSGYQGFGASRSGGNQFTESATWSWAEIVNRTIRRHQVKWGGEFRVNLDNVNSPTTNFGSYAFTCRLDATKRADRERRQRQRDCLAAAGHAE